MPDVGVQDMALKLCPDEVYSADGTLSNAWLCTLDSLTKPIIILVKAGALYKLFCKISVLISLGFSKKKRKKKKKRKEKNLINIP